jgi:hypothetical protein
MFHGKLHGSGEQRRAAGVQGAGRRGRPRSCLDQPRQVQVAQQRPQRAHQVACARHASPRTLARQKPASRPPRTTEADPARLPSPSPPTHLDLGRRARLGLPERDHRLLHPRDRRLGALAAPTATTPTGTTSARSPSTSGPSATSRIAERCSRRRRAQRQPAGCSLAGARRASTESQNGRRWRRPSRSTAALTRSEYGGKPRTLLKSWLPQCAHRGCWPGEV